MERLFMLLILMIICQGVDSHPAYGIVMDHQGNLYFTDIMHNGRGTLWKLDKDKKLIAVLKDFHAHNVNVDRDGKIYSAHGEDTHLLVRISPNSVIDTIIKENDISKFFGGNCVVGNDGRVYYGIEKKIWKWSENGRTSITDGDLKWNQGFYLDDTGKIYATDIGLGRGGCLVEIDSDGSSLVIADNLIEVGDRDFDPTHEVLLGVRKDKIGNLYVCDLGGKRVAKINPDGNVTTHYQSKTEWKPCGIFFSDDAEYIIEIGKNWQGPRIIKKVGPNTEVYFDYDTHQNHQETIPGPGGVKVPWLILVVFLPAMVFALYQLRTSTANWVIKAA